MDVQDRDKRQKISYDQSKLQDFVECPRRFQLRYLMEQEWPTPAAEPLTDTEQVYELGRRFHLVMERHWRGLPIERVDPALSPWWEAFLSSPPPDLPGTVRRPEVTATAIVAGQRMTATFDLLAYAPDGEAVIVDWKTSRRPPFRILDRRLQTIVYPLMLVEASPRLVGRQLKPEAVRLIYWFADNPEPGITEVFQYSAARYEEDQRYLTTLLHRLFSMNVNEWPLTSNEKLCRLCQYRSLCNRGRDAGTLVEEAGESWPDIEELRGVINEAAAANEYVL
jgi:CRISPR/Cas system-associated exonuclease Cas4 (RecB family)